MRMSEKQAIKTLSNERGIPQNELYEMLQDDNEEASELRNTLNILMYGDLDEEE